MDGLGTVATSIVDNNTHRLLDPDEFRGFALVDDIAPLVFVNTQQTLIGQIFTLAHEYAQVWRGELDGRLLTGTHSSECLVLQYR